MDRKTFKSLFQNHPDKISQAWDKLSPKDLEVIRGDLNRFLKKVAQVYKIPPPVILKELDAVQKNIEEGINSDFSPRLDPRE